jgi:hypothetical protein
MGFSVPVVILGLKPCFGMGPGLGIRPADEGHWRSTSQGSVCVCVCDHREADGRSERIKGDDRWKIRGWSGTSGVEAKPPW